MNTDKFQRKPFYVDAVQVTEKNLESIAKWCGGVVTHTDPKIAEQLKRPVATWIQVDNVQSPMNDRQKQAFVGDWVLFAKGGFKIYTAGAFQNTFVPVMVEQGETGRQVKIHVDPRDPNAQSKPAETRHVSRTPKATPATVMPPVEAPDVIDMSKGDPTKTPLVPEEIIAQLEAAGFALVPIMPEDHECNELCTGPLHVQPINLPHHEDAPTEPFLLPGQTVETPAES